MTKLIMEQEQEYAAGNITCVELYLMFSTDLDFGVDLDGLESFIGSRLGNYSLIYNFRASEISIGHYDDKKLIKLSVNLPVYAKDLKQGRIEGSNVYFHSTSWANDAIEQILLPAYMWIFAELGIMNRHGLSTYFRSEPFDILNDGRIIPIRHWLKSEFVDGVRLLPRIETMSGNYEGSWAQFRFILEGAKDYGDSKEYIESVKDELKQKYDEE